VFYSIAVRFPRLPRIDLRPLVRMLVLTVLALLGVNGLVAASSDCCTTFAVESAVSDADHDPCCDSEGLAADEGNDQCPCPLPCNPGCAGQSLRALASAPGALVQTPRGVRLDQPIHHELRPPGPEPSDILHVPKSIRS
jgi:hypothetical protein